MICIFKVTPLSLADVFESFCKKFLEIYELDPTHFFSTRISMASMLKKTGVEIRIINRF